MEMRIISGRGEMVCHCIRLKRGEDLLDSIKQLYTVVSTTLNVRSAADASVNNVVGQLKKGTVVEVTDLAISPSAAVWGKVSYKNAESVTITGYICLTEKYVVLGDQSKKEETPAPEVVPPVTTPTVPTTPVPDVTTPTTGVSVVALGVMAMVSLAGAVITKKH